MKLKKYLSKKSLHRNLSPKTLLSLLVLLFLTLGLIVTLWAVKTKESIDVRTKLAQVSPQGNPPDISTIPGCMQYQLKNVACSYRGRPNGEVGTFSQSTFEACYLIEGDEIVIHWTLNLVNNNSKRLQSGDHAIKPINASWPGHERQIGLVSDRNQNGRIDDDGTNNPNTDEEIPIYVDGSYGGECTNNNDSIFRDAAWSSLHGYCNRACQNFGTPEEIRLPLSVWGSHPIYVYFQNKVPFGALCEGGPDPCSNIDEEYDALIILDPSGSLPSVTLTPPTTPTPPPTSTPTTTPCPCNGSGITMSYSPTPGQTGSSITFNIRGTAGQGETYIDDTWSGEVDCSGAIPLHWEGSQWVGSKTCNATSQGTRTWTHYWKTRADGPQCQKTKTYTIEQGPSVTATPTSTPTFTPTPTSTPYPTPTTPPIADHMNVKFKVQGVGGSRSPQRFKVTLKKDDDVLFTDESIESPAGVNGGFTVNIDTTSFCSEGGKVDLLIKSQSHLQKKHAGLNLTCGSILFNFTSDPKKHLLVGDVNGDNVLDIIDIASILTLYTDLTVPVSPGTPQDINFDEAITIEDIAFTLINFTDIEIPGDE